MKFYERLKEQNVCDEALDWLKENKFPSKQSAWDACPRADWMLWAWGNNVIKGSKEHKQLVLACCSCTRTSVKFIKDKKLKKLVEKCLETTEGWARGENTLEEVEAARNAADAARAAAANTANAAAYYAANTANAAAYYAAYAAADAADYAANNREAALKKMANIVRKIQPKCPKFLKG